MPGGRFGLKRVAGCRPLVKQADRTAKPLVKQAVYNAKPLVKQAVYGGEPDPWPARQLLALSNQVAKLPLPWVDGPFL